MYVDIVISNVFNLNKKIFFFFFSYHISLNFPLEIHPVPEPSFHGRFISFTASLTSSNAIGL